MANQEPKPQHHERLSEVYERLLQLCDLSDKHKAMLTSRGISTDMIEQAGYKSMPRSRVGIATTLAKEFETLKGVPGFWLPDDKGKNAKWQLKGTSGLMIPVRDEAGKINQIKIRPDIVKEKGGKYISLSSKKDPSGTAAISQPHWPAAKVTSTIRITEGELKADIATALSGVYTVSAAGVHSWRKAADAVLVQNPEQILVCFDSDKDSMVNQYTGKEEPEPDAEEVEQRANDVGKATAKLARYLAAHHDDVKIETWDESLGKGIDDVLVDGGETRVMTVDEANRFITEKLSGLVQFGWFYCGMLDRMCNYDNPAKVRSLKTNAWSLMNISESNQKPLENFMLDPASKKYERIVYLPKQERELPTGEADGGADFNSWSPHHLTGQEGDVSPLLDHIRVLLPEIAEADVLERYLAWLIGREGEKLLWMVLMRGQQGVGKSFFGELLKYCIGESKISEPSNSDVAKDWGGWATDCSVVVMDEFDVGSSRNKSQVMDKLKMLITQNRISIELKGRDAYYVPNIFNIIAFTNKDRAAWIDEHDRRYFYVELAERPEKGTPEREADDQRLSELWDWLRTEDAQRAIIHWAENYDHSWMEEYGYRDAPTTSSKLSLIKDNKHPLTNWVEESIEHCQHPFNRDVVSPEQVLQFLPNYLRGTTKTSLGKAMNNAGATNYKNLVKYGAGNKSKVRLKILRDHERYENMTMGQLRSAWMGDNIISSDAEADEMMERLIDTHRSEQPQNPLSDEEPI